MKGLLKFANCTEETMRDKKKTWDEVLQDGRKKLGMDLATLKTGLNVEEGVCEEVLSESPTLGRGNWTFTWI